MKFTDKILNAKLVLSNKELQGINEINQIHHKNAIFSAKTCF